VKSLDKAWLGVLLAASFVGMLWCQGCAMTPMQKARFALATTGEAVVAADRIIAPRYAAALGAATTHPETIRRFNVAVESLLLARSALFIAEASLDAVEAGADDDIRGVMGCVVTAVQRLIDTLPDIGVEVPEALTMVMSLLGAFAGTCEPADHASTAGVPHVSDAIAVIP
jgi:hypothetical protein